MESTRLRIGIHDDDSDDDDPYSFERRRSSYGSSFAECFGEPVLHEGWCLKQSQWMREWRRR